MAKKEFKYYPREEINSIVELAERSKRLYGDSIAYIYKEKKQRVEKTYIDLVEDSKKLAQMLMKKNLKTGHIALIGASSYWYIVSYYAAMYAGLVIVPLDKELLFEDVYEQMEKADVDFFLYDRTYRDYAEQVAEKTNGTMGMFCINNPVEAEGEDLPFPEVDPDKLSTIIFTSGTTGKGKGVMLTQRNIARNVVAGLSHAEVYRNDVFLSVLPMNHAYECLGNLFLVVYCGATCCISSGIRHIAKELIEYKPTAFFAVPLIPQMLIDKVWGTAKKEGKEKKLNFGIKLCRFLKKFGIDLTDKILAEVKSAFGGRLRLIVAGGAPVTQHLIDSCGDLGIKVIHGYGLSECSPLLAFNFDYYQRPNSCGRIVKDCEMKVVDGELWARGVSVSTGYYNDPENTAENFVDGWFRTGDMGYIDDDGFVFITGRKKNLIILGNGKNVAPEGIEADIEKAIPYVSEVVVLGIDDKLCAAIYIDEESGATEQQLHDDIAEFNKEMPVYKQITSVYVSENPFPRTTTKKIIRSKVEDFVMSKR